MHSIDIAELTPHAQALLNQIKPGEELIVTSQNQTVARIIRVNGQETEPGGKRKRRRAGTAKGNVWMAPDFNEPLEDFAEYM
jgi:antitoxin (DNA-binding transcriptional repressor) of toxin-antitoxin stability system